MALNLGLENLQKVEEKLPSQEELAFAVETLATRLAVKALEEIEKNAHNIKTIIDTTKQFNSSESLKFAETLLGFSIEEIVDKTNLSDREYDGVYGKEYTKAYKATKERIKLMQRRAIKAYEDAKKHIPQCSNQAAIKKFKEDTDKLLPVLRDLDKDLKKKAVTSNPDKGIEGDGVEASTWSYYQKTLAKLWSISRSFLKVA